MYRAEIIANRSVRSDLVESLEKNIPDILYTIIPDVCGRGGSSRKLGTTIWPELNFILLAYITDDNADEIRRIVSELKTQFPDEGIASFLMHSDD
jgi:hypothetical protein